METPPKETWINPKIEVRKTKGNGKGMIALDPFVAGEILIIFGGEYTDAKGAEEARSKGKLVMRWDDDLFSVEERGEDLGYFINHSCEANAWMKDAFTVVAMRGIKVGEEITVDYALWEADEKYIAEWECACGSPLCRKKLTGKDWRLPELQKRYKNHFTPLINKRIENLRKIRR